MNYDVVRTNIVNACQNYKHNDAEFYSSMDIFYKEGRKNPSVARIMLQDHVSKRQTISKKMMNDVTSFSQADIPAILYPEFAGRIKQLYNISALETLRSLTLTDIYKETAYIKDKQGNYERRDFDKKWAELYPKTGKIREHIIEANRISMDSVNKKAGWFEKINFAKTLAEYKKDYPKTFYTRYALVMNEQIAENNVTPRVKGWFSRFLYKRFLRENFCFRA